jgi:S1-C subfamily serine protease
METSYPVSNNGSRRLVVLVTVLVIVLLSVFALLIFYYEDYRNSSSQVTNLENNLHSVEEQQIISLQSLLTGNGTYPGTAYFTNSSENINPEKIYAYANASIVTIQGIQQISNGVGGTTPTLVLGSGFVVSYANSYYVITNDHVVAGDSNMSVTFSDGDGYSATIVGTDPYSDLAVVSAKAPNSEFYPLEVVPSSNLTVGEPVVAIGNPFGLSGSMTQGLVSQLGRTIQDPTAGNFPVADVIQISTPINPGNSGGPLLNAFGQVVGITTAVVSGSQGVGFAIPSDTILREISLLVSTGTYDLHPYLGISEEAMSYDVAKAVGINVTYGVLINSTVPGGPSANKLFGGTKIEEIDGQGYIIGGDIIISANGTRIISIDALASWLEQYALPGDLVQFGIIRNGATMSVSILLGTRPSQV